MSEKQFNTNDRDMLIVLNTKVDQLSIDIKDIKSDLVTRIAKIEARQDAMDVYHAAIPLKEYDEIARWASKLRNNFNLIIVGGGLLMGFIGGLADRLFVQIFHF